MGGNPSRSRAKLARNRHSEPAAASEDAGLVHTSVCREARGGFQAAGARSPALRAESCFRRALRMARRAGEKAPGHPSYLLHQPLAASSSSGDPAMGVKHGCSQAGLGEAGQPPTGWEALETPVSS